jgi:hypothetical protein
MTVKSKQNEINIVTLYFKIKHKNMALNFIDLFAGADYTSLAHIEINNYACNMLVFSPF